MAPKVAAVKAALGEAVREIFPRIGEEDEDGNEINLSVNSVRRLAEKKLDLETGFLGNEDWKAKTKPMIQAAVGECENEESAAPFSPVAPVSKSKNGVKKRVSPDERAPAKKRQKKALAASESELSELDDESEVEKKPAKKQSGKAKPAPKPKAKPKAKPAKKATKATKKRKVGSEEDEGTDGDDDSESPVLDEDENSDVEEPPPKKKTKPTPKADKSENDDSELSDVPSDPVPVKDKNGATDEIKAASSAKAAAENSEDSPLSDVQDTDKEDAKPDKKGKSKAEADDSDSSELSEVIDEPPEPKPKRKSKHAKSTKDDGAAKPKKGRQPKKPAEDVSPDEAEIKKLQGQLTKCGVRKMWWVELKKNCGDDNKAKIKYLKKQLADVGMDGRFSEAKAREIKEQRELQADLEAVKEMNSHWGVGSGRASRGRSCKPIKGLSDGEDDDEDENKDGDNEKGDGDDDEDEDAMPAARAGRSNRARDALAFLGSESESD